MLNTFINVFFLSLKTKSKVNFFFNCYLFKIRMIPYSQ